MNRAVFPPPSKERFEAGIAQPLEEMQAVEGGVKEPGTSGSKELSVVFVAFPDERVFQNSADFFICIEGKIGKSTFREVDQATED